LSSLWEVLPKEEWADWDRVVLFAIEGLRGEGIEPPYTYRQISGYIKKEGLDTKIEALSREVNEGRYNEGILEQIVGYNVRWLGQKGICKIETVGSKAKVYPLWE